ncbi:MAG: hypothetical protein ABEJ31_00345 [Haloarculaceae archaeon]
MTRLRRLVRSRAWLFAVAFGLFAYLFHKVGSAMGYYPRFFWFQMAAHFLSATAMALLLARAGLDGGLRGRALVAFVLGFSALGAVGWEVVEYLGVFPSLHWWGLDDSLLDLCMDTLGVATVLSLLGTRVRPVINPTLETPLPGRPRRGH